MQPRDQLERDLCLYCSLCITAPLTGTAADKVSSDRALRKAGRLAAASIVTDHSTRHTLVPQCHTAVCSKLVSVSLFQVQIFHFFFLAEGTDNEFVSSCVA